MFPCLPEVFSAVNAGETLAAAADVHVFLHLGFFQGFTTTIAGEENHFSPSSHRNAELALILPENSSEEVIGATGTRDLTGVSGDELAWEASWLTTSWQQI